MTERMNTPPLGELEVASARRSSEDYWRTTIAAEALEKSVLERQPLSIMPVPYPEGKLVGLHSGWVDGKAGETDVSFQLTVGAGLGNPNLMLSVYNGAVVVAREFIDVRTFLPTWFGAILKANPGIPA